MVKTFLFFLLFFSFNLTFSFLIHEPQTNETINKSQKLNRKKQITILVVILAFIYHLIIVTYINHFVYLINYFDSLFSLPPETVSQFSWHARIGKDLYGRMWLATEAMINTPIKSPFCPPRQPQKFPQYPVKHPGKYLNSLRG